MNSDTALLIIDVQEGLLADQDFPIYDADGLVTRLSAVIQKARAENVPIIYIQHCGSNEADPLHPSKPGWAIASSIAPQPGDIVVEKRNPDSFQETTLQQHLTERGIKQLVIGGMETPMCVDTTTRRAYSLGYKVTLIADGHSTPTYGTITAAQIIEHHNATLGNWFASVVPASEIVF
jgi:nicotinamidase-related amidase